MRLYFSPCVGNKGPKCLTVRLLIMATLRMLLSPPSWGGNGRVVTVHRASLQCIYAFYTPNRALMVNVSDDATNKTKEKNTNRKKNPKIIQKMHAGCGEGELCTCTTRRRRHPSPLQQQQQQYRYICLLCTHRIFKNILGDEDNIQATIRWV